jgi:hypothetical protein
VHGIYRTETPFVMSAQKFARTSKNGIRNVAIMQPQGLSDNLDIVFLDGENDGLPETNANFDGPHRILAVVGRSNSTAYDIARARITTSMAADFKPRWLY